MVQQRSMDKRSLPRTIICRITDVSVRRTRFAPDSVDDAEERDDNATEKDAENCLQDRGSEPTKYAGKHRSYVLHGMFCLLDNMFRQMKTEASKAVNNDTAADPQHGRRTNQRQNLEENRNAFYEAFAERAHK